MIDRESCDTAGLPKNCAANKRSRIPLNDPDSDTVKNEKAGDAQPERFPHEKAGRNVGKGTQKLPADRFPQDRKLRIDHMPAFIQLVDHRKNPVCGVLSVIIHKDGIIAADERDGGKFGVGLSGICCQIDTCDVTVPGAELFYHIPRSVGRAIVDENDLVCVTVFFKEVLDFSYCICEIVC